MAKGRKEFRLSKQENIYSWVIGNTGASWLNGEITTNTATCNQFQSPPSVNPTYPVYPTPTYVAGSGGYFTSMSREDLKVLIKESLAEMLNDALAGSEAEE